MNEYVKIVIEELESNDIPIKNVDKSTILFGEGGIIDSMGLVSLTIAIEERIDEEHNITITLADEKAMSQTRSPFRSVGSLADYLKELIDKEK